MFLIYFPIKKVFILSAFIAVSVIFIPEIGEITGIFDYYDSVNNIKVNELTETFFVNLTLTLILSYYTVCVYYAYKYLKTKYNINIKNTQRKSKDFDDYSKNRRTKKLHLITLNKSPEIQHRFLESFIIINTINCILRVISYFSLEIKTFAYLSFALLAIYIFFYYIFKKQIAADPLLFNILIIAYFTSHYFFVMGSYNFVKFPLFWFFIIPLILPIFYSLKKTFILSILLFISVYLLPQISTLLGVTQYYSSQRISYEGNHAFNLFLHNVIILLIALYYLVVFFHLYQIIKSNLKEITHISFSNENDTQNEEISNNIKEEHSNGLPKENRDSRNDFHNLRLKKTYQTIQNYLETEKPYTDPEYTLDQLAIDIHINRTYVSKSLNLIGKISFKDLINQYRIDAAKEKFINDTFRTQNIKQTYYSVGFRHQSTFNRAFKKCEGVTPSEFIINLENKHQ